MKKGIKYLIVLFSVVFLLAILIPAQSLISQEQADNIQLISVTPPAGTILQRGTEVPFEVKVSYKLESQPKGFVIASLTLLNGKCVRINPEEDVGQGSGIVVINGLVNVEDLYDWVETDTVYLRLEIGYWYSDSKDEAEVLDYKCLIEYPYYIKGEAPPVVSPSFKKVLKAPIIPTLSYPNPFVRATITYNLIDDNTYEVSEIHFDSKGVGIGFIEFFICYQEKYSRFTPVFLPGVAKWKKIIYTRSDIDRAYHPSLKVNTNDVIGLGFAGFTEGSIELGTHPLVMLTFIIAKMLRTAIPVTTTFEPDVSEEFKEEFTEIEKEEEEQRLPEEHLIEDAAFVYQLEDALEFSQDVLSKWLLLAPASAVFPDIKDSKVNVTKLDDNVYLIEAYVDSQNTSGAMVRSYYSVKVTVTLPVTITDKVNTEISWYDFEFSDYSILRDEYRR